MSPSGSESVTTNEKLVQTVDKDGYVSPKGFQFNLNYEAIIPLLTKAVQHLKAANDNQAKSLEDLRREFRAYKAAHP